MAVKFTVLKLIKMLKYIVSFYNKTETFLCYSLSCNYYVYVAAYIIPSLMLLSRG